MKNYLASVTGVTNYYKSLGFVKQVMTTRRTDTKGEAGGYVVECITVRFTEDELPLTNEIIHDKVTQYD